MLKWISKSGTFVQFTIFFVFFIVFWVPSFVHHLPPVLTPADGPLYKLLITLFQQNSQVVVALALLLVLIQSFVSFYVLQANGLLGRNNFLPAIIILLAYSWNANYQTMHAVLPAGVFIIIALHAIMDMYGRQAAYHQVFTAAFSLGIASLFYLPITYMLLLLWFTLITYRVSAWREYAVSVIGYILPFIYYVSWLFWNDSLGEGLKHLPGSMFNFILPARISLLNTIWLLVSLFVTLITMMAVLNVMNDKLISLRRKAWVLFNYTLVALVIVVVAGWPFLSVNYLFVIPMSFFIAGSISLIKRSFWFEMIVFAYFMLFISLRVYLIL